MLSRFTWQKNFTRKVCAPCLTRRDNPLACTHKQARFEWQRSDARDCACIVPSCPTSGTRPFPLPTHPFFRPFHGELLEPFPFSAAVRTRTQRQTRNWEPRHCPSLACPLLSLRCDGTLCLFSAYALQQNPPFALPFRCQSITFCSSSDGLQ